jgi:hypothetical protein
LLTTSAHDNPTNNGEDNDDGGRNSNHLISRHVLTSRAYLTCLLHVVAVHPTGATDKGKAGRREAPPAFALLVDALRSLFEADPTFRSWH